MANNDFFDDLPMKAEKEITSCNILKVQVGTTGFCGGDSGHGGRTYFSLEDLASTDMTILVGDQSFKQGKVELCFGGDTELETLAEALEFAAKSLKVMAGIE